jgi:homogentisate 1,2-dioxygenase
MLDRMQAGELPPKHHIAFRGPDQALRHEECITRQGFDGPYTIAYHLHRPHTHRAIAAEHGFALPRPVTGRPLRKRHFKSGELTRAEGPRAPVDARVPLIFNQDVAVYVTKPTGADPVYFSNGDADDLHYVHQGSGTVRTVLGDLRYQPEDYVCIPKGIVHRFLPDEGSEQTWLSIECNGGLGLLKQWRTETGQLRMDAPYCHRDFRRPEFRGPLDEGIREVVVKRDGAWHGFAFEHSPLDVVGWDGSAYPFVFPILNFQPRAGLVHLPPDWHGTFATRGALICSFVPRVVDFHPEAIPCPYPHASVDCDEVLFYARGNFISRRGVGPGSLSYHPAGIPHGPHPGAYEGSIGAKTTEELAVMMDTFAPLHVTEQAVGIEDPDYHATF